MKKITIILKFVQMLIIVFWLSPVLANNTENDKINFFRFTDSSIIFWKGDSIKESVFVSLKDTLIIRKIKSFGIDLSDNVHKDSIWYAINKKFQNNSEQFNEIKFITVETDDTITFRYHNFELVLKTGWLFSIVFVILFFLSLLVYFGIKYIKTKKLLFKYKDLHKILNNKQVNEYIKQHRLKADEYNQTLIKIINHLSDTIEKEQNFIRQLDEISDKKKEIQFENDKLKHKIFELQEEKNNNDSIRKDLEAKLSLVEKNSRTELEKEKEKHKTEQEYIKEEFSVEIDRFKAESGELQQYIKDVLICIRDLDIKTGNMILDLQEWNHDTSINNIILYLLSLRSELNIVYCLFSDNEIKLQTNNMNEIIKNKDEQFEKLITQIKEINLNKRIRFHIERDKQKSTNSIISHVFRIFNQRLNRFPRSYYFGINDEEKIN